MIVLGEMRGEHAHPGEVDLSSAEPLQQDRESACDTRGANPLTGHSLREVEEVDAVAVHGGAALREVEVPSLDLAEVRQEIRLAVALFPDELCPLPPQRAAVLTTAQPP